MQDRVWAGIVIAAVVASGTGCPEPASAPEAELAPLPPPRVQVLETDPLRIDRLYPSMAGPSQRVEMDPWEMEWISSFRTEVIDARTDEPMSEEFFCHAQLQRPDGYRPIVTATGISEIRFPEGFGMPLTRLLDGPRYLPDSLSFFGMVLNNHKAVIDEEVRVRATVEYWKDEDLGSPPRVKPLYRATLPMTVGDLAEYIPPVDSDVTTHCVLFDGLNNHWLVPPGPQKTRKIYPGNFLEEDTTVHYGVAHLHNHGVYMRLTDTTTGEVLWQTDVVYEPDRVQIAEIPVYSSRTGFRLYADHEYEIEAFYDNTTDHDIDAMAMMSLYHHPGG